MITFNKVYFTGKEAGYITDTFACGKISGNGKYTQLCHDFFEKCYGFKKCLLTTSCTDALEMAAILLNIVPGDEVIMPSYTFVSTANAFVLRGAKIVFADSMAQNPNIDAESLEFLITSKTKVIVPVHYAGIACDMDTIMAIARKYNLFVVEDAAQAIDSYYIGKDGIRKPLGSIGHLAVFSFHETKNIISGEGGMLVINDEQFLKRAEIVWENGTNRSAFFRGESDNYGWVDIGSSFLPSEIVAAFLYAQLEHINQIQERRLAIWNLYYDSLVELGNNGIIGLPGLPNYATNNAHMFYLVCKDFEQRTLIIEELRKSDVHAVFHYLSLHRSEFYKDKHDNRALGNSDSFSERLVRLPFYYELADGDVKKIAEAIVKIVSK